jgi:hypothetical protein
MTSTTFVACAFSALTIVPAQSDQPVAIADQDAVMQLRLERDHQEMIATAVLVHRDDGPHGVVLYFLTSESLLFPASSPPQFWPDAEGEMSTRAPAPSIAVLRILIENSPLVPARVTIDPPQLGEPFFIVSRDAAGARVLVLQHIGVMSARDATGDVPMPTPGCVGAPAVSEKGVFGIVRECEPNRPHL